MPPATTKSSTGTIAIVGGGIGPSITGLAFHRRGWAVTLLEPEPQHGDAEAGILTAAAGIEEQQPDLITLTLFAREQWLAWEQSLAGSFLDTGGGTTILAHPRDAAAMERLRAGIDQDVDVSDELVLLDRAALTEREPALTRRFTNGLALSLDRCINPDRLRAALDQALSAAGTPRIRITAATQPKAHHVLHDGASMPFDWVVDWREPIRPGERIMRRDLLRLQTAGELIHHPLRLMHPRHPLYLLPRGGGRYDVAAVQSVTIPEADIRAKTMLELLSAAYTVHPGFAEATVLGTVTACVAAHPGGLPTLLPEPGLITVTGAGAYAMASAPALADIITHFITQGETHPLADGIMQSWQL